MSNPCLFMVENDFILISNNQNHFSKIPNLKLNNWKGKYTGVDIVPGLINEAKKRNPEVDILNGDITNKDFKVDKHDFVIASGVMNESLTSGENTVHIKSMLENMFRLANKMVCIDFPINKPLDIKSSSIPSLFKSW